MARGSVASVAGGRHFVGSGTIKHRTWLGMLRQTILSIIVFVDRDTYHLQGELVKSVVLGLSLIHI